MINGFERISIDVPDLAAALACYSPLLGEFSASANGAFRDLNNIRIALSENRSCAEAAIDALFLWDENRAAGQIDSGALGINLYSVDERVLAPSDSESGIHAVDHLVLMSNDSDACIDLFGDTLGMRLALDRMVPEWGGRMLFFRAGKMTLEVIHNVASPPAQSRFWGISYRCGVIEQTLQWLDHTRIEHSDIRPGRKPGTRVATIKSHNLGLPTLLLEPAA